MSLIVVGVGVISVITLGIV
jgi:hypothetical protein